MQEKTDYAESGKKTVLFDKIFDIVIDSNFLFYRHLQHMEGMESLGCVFHVASRELAFEWRLG